jgi:hypothetical protein
VSCLMDEVTNITVILILEYVSFVNKNWVYRLITVSLKVLEKHTADNLSSHVRQELAALGINL